MSPKNKLTNNLEVHSKGKNDSWENVVMVLGNKEGLNEKNNL